MKRLMVIATVLAIGMFITAVFNTAMAESTKGPIGKVVTAAVDTTKKVGTVAGDAVGAVSDTAVTATKSVTGAAGDTIQAVSDTTEKATEDILK